MKAEDVLEIYDKPALQDHAFFVELSAYLNHLILHDFEKLVQLLYRIDIDEHKLKTILQQHNDDAGKIMAEMIIKRQLEKIKTREQFRQMGGDW